MSSLDQLNFHIELLLRDSRETLLMTVLQGPRSDTKRQVCIRVHQLFCLRSECLLLHLQRKKLRYIEVLLEALQLLTERWCGIVCGCIVLQTHNSLASALVHLFGTTEHMKSH